MTDGAAKFGARVEMKRNDGQSEGQIGLLETALSRADVQGVAVSVLDAETPGIADKIRGGKVHAAGAIVGAVMKATKGQADAARVRELVMAACGQTG